MAVRSKEEILNSLKAVTEGNNSDEALALYEDVSDTFDDYETRVGEDWKSKYEENDTLWRNRYLDRFFGSERDTQIVDEAEGAVITDPPTEDRPLTYEELFKEEEDL